MIYPDFIKKNDVIAVAAPSDGNRKEVDFLRVKYAKETIEHRGYQVRLGEKVCNSEMGRSDTGEGRAKTVMEFFLDDKVKHIVSAKGGDFLMECLPYLDFERIKENPTWFQGYSDNTGITFLLTTICDMASMYSNHFNDFAMEPLHGSLENNLSILQGELVKQESFDFYEDGFYDKETGKETFHKDQPVEWKGNAKQITVKGRQIGGCLDVLVHLCGTKYDKVKEFADKYKKDGILWYMESFALNSEELRLSLWQLKEAGWFENVSGFVFGRPCFYESPYGYEYHQVLEEVLGEFEVPIIWDADTGHKGPQFTVVNGCIATWDLMAGKGSLTQTFYE